MACCAVLRYRSVVGRLLFLVPGARKNRGARDSGDTRGIGKVFLRYNRVD